MPKKRVISSLCIFILVPGLLFSVLAARKARNPTHDALLTPQTVTLIINEIRPTVSPGTPTETEPAAHLQMSSSSS